MLFLLRKLLTVVNPNYFSVTTLVSDETNEDEELNHQLTMQSREATSGGEDKAERGNTSTETSTSRAATTLGQSPL